MDSRWLVNDPGRPDAELRLFCLSYAGGSASVYHRWRTLVPAYLDVAAVELPGRGRRLGEPAFHRLSPLVRAMATALEPALDRPFALFGHSMGGLLAFELARTLRERGLPAPVHLFVSAAAAPALPRGRPQVHSAPDEELKSELRYLNGTPPEVLEDAELMALTLPILRADYSVLENYEYRLARKLDLPITVFGGDADHTVARSSLAAWRDETSARTTLQLVRGDHFFVRGAAPQVVRGVVRALEPQRSRVPAAFGY